MLRSGLAHAITWCPSAANGAMTSSQLDASANAPWTRMTVGGMSGSSLGEGGNRLAGLDDVGREHAARLGAEIQRVVRRAGRDQEPLARLQGQGVAAVDLHLDRPGDDVADLLAGMLMPAG